MCIVAGRSTRSLDRPTLDLWLTMTGSKFWRMREPEYDSDYDHTFINGSLEHPYGLPGVACGTCGQTWGGSRVLPVVCPAELRDVHELNEAWPIPAEAHRQLRDRVRAAIIAERGQCPELLPGDEFQPSFLDVPSTPVADFLWASLGSIVVSDRMRPFFGQLGPEVLSIEPVHARKVGAARPTLPAPIPDSGEPEDLLTGMTMLAPEPPRYFELVVTAESAIPHGANRRPPCAACGRVELEGSRELWMYDDMAPGEPLFFLATTRWLIVTDPFKRELERLDPSNVRFSPVG
jgi:Protein of unknown function (Gmx_para_CXXCG)